MAEATVLLPDTGTKKAHFWDRVVGANTVLEEFTLPGEYPLASYSARASTISAATSADHLMQIMAGTTLVTRVRRIRVRQQAAAAAVGATVLQIVRLTTAGTGGTAVTPSKLDNADGAFSGAAMTLPTAKGTEGAIIWDDAFWAGTAAIPVRDTFEWEQCPNCKPITIPAGTANGIAVKVVTGLGSLTVSVDIMVVESNVP